MRAFECLLMWRNEYFLKARICAKGCDLGWKRRKLFGIIPRSSFRGELINGESTIFSERDPTVQLRVSDELHLWKNTLWINDRVRNSNGDLIIGNKLGIPYKLRKCH